MSLKAVMISDWLQGFGNDFFGKNALFLTYSV